MYIAAGQEQTTPGDKLWCQQKPLVTSVICCNFQKISLKSDFIQFLFTILYMYIAPGQGLTTPWGWNFDVNMNTLSLRSFVASLKKISLKSCLFVCLCWGLTSQSTIFQSCRDGATASWVINQYFWGVKCLAQGHNTAAVGFSLKSDFIHCFSWFYTCI